MSAKLAQSPSIEDRKMLDQPDTLGTISRIAIGSPTCTLCTFTAFNETARVAGTKSGWRRRVTRMIMPSIPALEFRSEPRGCPTLRACPLYRVLFAAGTSGLKELLLF